MERGMNIMIYSMLAVCVDVVSLVTGVLEVCGSWKKVAPQLEASQMADVERKLAEAIDDHQHSSHPSQPQVTMATRRSSQTKTGFHTPNDAL